MDVQLKGIELLYYLMKRFKMSYSEAIKEMKDNNQDISFIDEMSAQYEANQMLIDENDKLNEEF